MSPRRPTISPRLLMATASPGPRSVMTPACQTYACSSPAIFPVGAGGRPVGRAGRDDLRLIVVPQEHGVLRAIPGSDSSEDLATVVDRQREAAVTGEHVEVPHHAVFPPECAP